MLDTPSIPTSAGGTATRSEDAYSAAGYDASSSVGRGRHPAVLVVDLQLAFTDARYPLGKLPMVHAATERTGELLRVARTHRIPVAQCYTGYQSAADMPHWKVQPVREQFLHGHPSLAIDKRVHDARYDFSFCKSAPSIFFLTPLMAFLTKQGVDTVIVTGCTTSGCVRASVVDAFSYGFRVLVAEDCCGDAAREPHEANLRDISRRYADVISASEAEDYLRGFGGT
ncbi:MAG TPA: isochorismatase family protein [Steroidobacteraceae bacterium]|nr:isochorismatase family protein [Steroidobacteraceae bacterium]